MRIWQNEPPLKAFYLVPVAYLWKREQVLVAWLSLYEGYEKVLLVDYSLSLLQEARHFWKDDRRFVFVAASLYDLPFVDDLLDSLVMIRVMHHLQRPDLALSELSRILNGGGVFVLEYANKRNLKAITRYLLKRQSWSPFDSQPYEFVHLNYDFHPAWMKDVLNRSGLEVTKELAISSFRLEAVKRNVPPDVLARLDTLLASPGARFKLTPSVVLRCSKSTQPSKTSHFFRCPDCLSTEFLETQNDLVCQLCSKKWAISDGVYDFRNTQQEKRSD